jgi:hypothetical protein
LAWSAATAQLGPDPAAAEREYRLAQRLGADQSPDAAAAFERVVMLAPQGPYADDALVDLARLRGAPDWLEEVGGISAARVASARASLERVVNDYADGDRILEARYRLALLKLAPLPGRDAAGARPDLIALASAPPRERWVVAARYALGVLDELSGARARAAGAFARIVVERPDSDIAPRARVGFARALLAEERFGEAAGWFQEAIAAGIPSASGAQAQRELAVREVMRQRTPARRWTSIASPLAVRPTTRGASLMAIAADGRVVVFDRKRGVIQSFDSSGRATTIATAADVTALATDPFGRVFAATKEQLLRWDGSGGATTSSLGSFGSPAALAVDFTGAVWIVDRRGDRIGRWIGGTTAPAVVRESKGAGITSVVVSGERVIVAEEKTGRLVTVTVSGDSSAFGTATFRRPAALAIDAAGRISVLDEKADTVTRLAPSGEVRDTLNLEAAGVSRPVALASAPDGALRILDGSNGSVAEAP